MPLMTFAEAIVDSDQFSKRHLLIGDGFSIVCRANISLQVASCRRSGYLNVGRLSTSLSKVGNVAFVGGG